MKTTKIALAISLLLGALLSAGPAFAWKGHHHRHHHHHGLRFGIVIGAPLVAAWPYYYHPRPVYYPAPVVVQQPPVYIEQSAPAPAPQSWWYYCADSRAYYPHVRDCPGGWQRVAPQPQS